MAKRKTLAEILCISMLFTLVGTAAPKSAYGENLNLMSEMAMESELQSMNGYEEGKDYSEGKAFFEADSEEEAMKVAKSYDASLESYSSGIGILSFEGSVKDKLEEGVDTLSVTTPIYPDYYVYTEDYINRGTLLDGSEDGEKADVQTAVTDPDYSYQWFHSKVKSEEAWKVSNGDGVKVAVIDNCFMAEHSDLVDNVAATYNAADGSEDVSLSSNIKNKEHGTHVAGIIGAVSDNGLFGTGVAPKAELYLVKIANAEGKLTISSVIRALEWAAEHKVEVVNMSIGTTSISQGTKAQLQEAIDDVVDTGAAVVVAAGNYGTSTECYPAACDNVIAVGAIGKKTASHTADTSCLADYSDYGDYVDLAAPGTAIYSTVPENGTSSACDLDGTSMAAPIVTGVAALVYSAHPELISENTETTAKAVMKKLTSSTDDVKYSSSKTGGTVTGCIDAKQAVEGSVSYTEPSFYVKLKDKTITNGGTYWLPLGKSEKLVITDKSGKKIKEANKKGAASFEISGSASFKLSNKKVKCDKKAAAYSLSTDSVSKADSARVTITYGGEKIVLRFIALDKIKAAGYTSGNKIKKNITRTVPVGKSISINSAEALAGLEVDYWSRSGKTYNILGDADSVGYVLKVPAKASKNGMITENSEGEPLTFTPSRKGSYKFTVVSPANGVKFKITLKAVD